MWGEREYARLPSAGERVDLEVNIHEGVVDFKPEFVFSDSILQEKYHKEHGDDDIYHYFALIADEFRSVRIFKVARGEEVSLHDGEQWRGRVVDWRVSDRKSKDGRAKIYVTVRDLLRCYRWSIDKEGDNLVLSLKCGERLLRRKSVPLKERLYRFRVEGDPTKIITEIRAVGTPKRPIVLVDSHFPRRTNLRELVDAELAVFSRKVWSAALQKAAAQNVLETIRVVSPETLRKYCKVPFIRRNAGPSSALRGG